MTGERAAIMQYDGGLSCHEAERLARERPWDTDPRWGFPVPVQAELDLKKKPLTVHR